MTWRTGTALVVGILIGLVLARLAFPRYEWRDARQYSDALLRIDRWTGATTLGVVDAKWGRWVPLAEMHANARAKTSQ